MARKGDVSLPTHANPKPRTKFQVRALLGHCLYRRVVIWVVMIFVLLTIILFDPRLTTQSRNVLDIVHGSKVLIKEPPSTAENVLLQNYDSVAMDLPMQEAIYEVEIEEAEVGEVEDAAKNTPSDMLNDEANDTPNNDPNSVPDDTPSGIISDVPKDDVVGQGEDTSEDEESKDWPRWLKYEQ